MIPIIENSHYATYSGDAYETYKKLTKDMNPIINKIYIILYNCFWIRVHRYMDIPNVFKFII